MKRLNLAEATAKLTWSTRLPPGKGVIIAKSGIPMAKLVPPHDEKPQEFKFGTPQGRAHRRIVEAIEAPLPGDLNDAMSNGPIDPDEGK